MRVGLFGYYRARNFGDELMAIVIAKHLQSQGHEVNVLGIPYGLASTVGAISTNEAGELASWSDVLVCGGGAWLSDFDGSNISKFQKKAEDDCFTLARVASEKDVPCFALSIGGNSIGISRGIRTGFMSYLNSPNLIGISTRLKADLDFLENLFRVSRRNVPLLAHFPDLVLSVRKEMTNRISFVDTTDRDVYTIAVDVGHSRADRWLVRSLCVVLDRIPGYRVLFFHNSIRQRDHFLEWYPYSAHMGHVAFDSPLEMLDALSNVDLVIAHRLHMGLAALGLGVPFLAYNSQKKTQLALQELDWDCLVWNTRARSIPGLFAELYKNKKDQSSICLPENLDVICSESSGHLSWLVDNLARL